MIEIEDVEIEDVDVMFVGTFLSNLVFPTITETNVLYVFALSGISYQRVVRVNFLFCLDTSFYN